MCLRMKGDDRPTMRNVEIRLQGLQCRENNVHFNLGMQEQLIGMNGLTFQEGNADASDNCSSRQHSMEEEMLLGVAAANCSTRCGNIEISYPFGVEPGCYHKGFNLTCDRSHQPPKLFLGDGSVEVLEVSIPTGTVRINSSSIVPTSSAVGTGNVNKTGKYHTWGGLRKGGPFFISPYKNKFLVLSCSNVQVLLLGGDNSTVNACATYCPPAPQKGQPFQFPMRNECSGIGCCSAAIPKGYTSYSIQIQPANEISEFDAESSVYIAEEGSYNATRLIFETVSALPALLDWAISNSTCGTKPSAAPAPACRSSNSYCQNYTSYVYNGYQCRCNAGYQGNPYIPNGCQGLSIGLVVSVGTVLLLLARCAPLATRKIKLQKMKKTKERFFKQNHGLLLQQLISQKDLEKATNNFDKSHEVGGGGHGIVYKGILDLHVVAIKKSKIVVQREIDQFINELLGCCLEAEVPLLVYEFVSNGTLYDHLHVEGPMSLLWDDQLRIALEVARAVAKGVRLWSFKVHSNRSNRSDNSCSGIFGYLDPMYYYTGRLTDRSDVFSFGVLLVELLTRKKPFVHTSSNGDALVLHFVSLHKENNLVDILDPQVMEEGDGEVKEVAALAATCIKLKGDDRPTMREVEMAIENLRVKKKHATLGTRSNRYDGDQIAADYLSTRGITDESIRQYTMEEEILLSASGREVMTSTSSSSFCCLAASLLLLPFFAMAAAAAAGSNNNCTTTCGDISIEYPFGVEAGCYDAVGFNLTCNHSYHPPRLFLGDGTVQVLDISIPKATVRINSSRMVFNSTDNHAVNRSLEVGRPYIVPASNRIALVSCNARVDVRVGRNNKTRLLSSCTAICPSDDGGGTTNILNIGPEGPCSGVGCCETIIVGSSTAYSIQVQNLQEQDVPRSNRTDLVYMVDERFNYTLGMAFGESSPEALPARLDWYINSNSSACPSPTTIDPSLAPECRSAHSYCHSWNENGYTCHCSDGYEGNPYLLAAVAEEPLPPENNCTTSCGDISIDYLGFNLTCNHSYHPPRLFLGDGTVQVLCISIPNATVRISSSRVHLEINRGGSANATWGGGLPSGGPFFLSESESSLVLMGCDSQAGFTKRLGARLPRPHGLAGVDATSSDIYIVDQGFNCTDLTNSDSTEYPPRVLPALLEWVISNSTSNCPINSSTPECRSAHSSCRDTDAGAHKGYLCECSNGYQGNPYIIYGCKGILHGSLNFAFTWIIDYIKNHIKNHVQSTTFPSSYLKTRLFPLLTKYNFACLDINECDSPHIYPCFGDCSNTQGGYNCRCRDGLKGNATQPKGCEDIDECADPAAHSCYGICINTHGSFHCGCQDGADGDPFKKGRCITSKTKNSLTDMSLHGSSFSGLNIALIVSGGSIVLILVLATPLVARVVKQRRDKKLKEKFFKQNHGLLLQQLISKNTDFGERMIITLEELQKATNNFDRSLQREIGEFINEVAILSQINHRNVVKLLGCCLETEVPLLVYEFISHGTLYHHLHVNGPISLSWDARLRISLEVARALSYLHSASSMPIYHRDIKSSNILLDDSLTAKISDFGASKYTPIDRSEITTAVQGTIGYLDPMYYYTGRLTDKSDKPVADTFDGDSLVSHFVSLLSEGNLIDIIDPQVKEEEGGEVHEVAALAALCTKLKGEERPSMREVEMALENILSKKGPFHKGNRESSRPSKNQISAFYMSIEGVATEASRQSMEEEMLSFP
uniref:Protein kinase domain-containing protein n=1 Tax=Oryza punctata TaxID=4537 RepID=A0A0E0LWJ0_ORYPU